MMATAAEVADFYDRMMASKWEKRRGEDAHNGYSELGDRAIPSDLRDVASDLQNARARMTVEVLKFAGISDDPLKKPKNIIDVGCGLGGTSRYLIKKYGAKCCGIDLSREQIRRALEITIAAGLQDKMSFIVGDVLDQSLPDGQFDLVLAFDVIDHTPDKLKFVSELARVAAPRASIIITTICHRELSPAEESLTSDEKNLLDKISKTQYTAVPCTPSAYVEIAQSLALKFVSELARIAAPGASIIITTICHRELSPGEESLTLREKILLDKICEPQHTVVPCAPSAYVKIAQSLALNDYKMVNWSEHVTPFWDIINRSHQTWWGLISLLLSGWDNIRWALALPRILEAYNKKLISYNVIACRKQE